MLGEVGGARGCSTVGKLLIGALRFSKIDFGTLVTHFRNIWLNEDLGCRIEGVLRRELLSEGEYHGVLRMDLCRG